MGGVRQAGTFLPCTKRGREPLFHLTGMIVYLELSDTGHGER
jgi:hypothetical protein